MTDWWTPGVRNSCTGPKDQSDSDTLQHCKLGEQVWAVGWYVLGSHGGWGHEDTKEAFVRGIWNWEEYKCDDGHWDKTDSGFHPGYMQITCNS